MSYPRQRGPIPAGAGETAIKEAKASTSRAYPRGCGGDFRSRESYPRSAGLSPRVRGRPLSRLVGRVRRGPIPAGAGETRARRLVHGRIWAYPRGCGGDVKENDGNGLAQGLSPRVRGRQAGEVVSQVALGPIPAGAGETVITSSTSKTTGAYPRGCGGDAFLSRGDSFERGLSPRVRGRQLAHGLSHPLLGPIPAGAGETFDHRASSARRRAYPRGCGGDDESPDAANLLEGLSPRVRGRPQGEPGKAYWRGPIPAGAGETLWRVPVFFLVGGLSPRVRGRRR